MLYVIESMTQKTDEMDFEEFINSFKIDSDKRTKVYNAFSLEFSEKAYSNLISPPEIATDQDWFDNELIT